MHDLALDLRHGIRMMLRNPGFATVAALSLALGIGANTAIFSLINAVFLSPLPVDDVSTLVMVFTRDSKQADNPFANLMAMSYPNYKDIREQTRVFDGLASYTFGGGTLVGDEGPKTVQGFLVTANYFDILGVKPALGRTFLPDEDGPPGGHPVMVLSHALWQRDYGADPSILGRTIRFNGFPFTVVGVAAENFKGTIQGMPGDLIWTPMSMYRQVLPAPFGDWPESRRALLMNVIGRLKQGVTLQQADAAVQTVAARLEKEYPDVNEARSAVVTRFTAFFNPEQESQLALVAGLMMAMVGIILLIACLNIANLLLARASARETEIGIRLALGAGRYRLVRQLLTESLLLAGVGGAVGLLLATWFRQILWQIRPPFLPADALDLSFDLRVLAFTVGISLLTGILFGLFPALQASRVNLTETLHEGTRSGGGTGPSQQRLRSGLVVAEIALAMVALIGAGLFVRSMQAAQQINPGFETERLASLFVNPAGAGYDSSQTEIFYRDLLERLGGTGGVTGAAIASNPPLGGGLMRSVIPEGAVSAKDRGILATNTAVSPGYFQTMAIPLLRGRDFTEFDTAQTPRVAVISEASRRRFWPGQDPIGKRFTFITEDEVIEVVGEVRDTLIALGQPPQPIIYVPFKQRSSGGANLIVRSAREPGTVLAEVQRLIRSIDRNLPVTNARTMRETMAQALWAPRMGAALLGIFGLLGLVLSMVGIYGIMSFSVTRRIREMGIRMALGAEGGDILGLVIRQGMILVALGLAFGLSAAWASSQVLTSLLYEISPTDGVTFAGVSALLVSTALLACFVPARRATRVDPIVALRHE